MLIQDLADNFWWIFKPEIMPTLQVVKDLKGDGRGGEGSVNPPFPPNVALVVKGDSLVSPHV